MDSHTTDAGHWTGIGILWLFWMFPVLIAGGNQTVFLQISNQRPARYCEYCTCKNTPDGILTNCTELGFENPPRRLSENTSELILKKNSIQEVQYKYLAGLYYLKILDLSENKISEIEHGAFKDLNNLTHLYMNGQRAVLFIPQNVFEPGVFEGLDSLKILYIHGNVDTRDADACRLPKETLSNLTALEELRIDGLPNITFGEKFNKLKDLKRLIMSGKSGTCLIRYLGRESFVGLENIEELTLEDCRIKQISTGTFWWTSRLKYLDLSWNTEIEIYNFGPVFAELKYTQLKVLKINAIHNPYRAGTEILRGNLRDLRDVKLIELHMNDNGIEFIDYGVFQMFPSTLKRLYMRRNKLNFGLYMFEAVFNNPNLEVFDAGDQAVGDRSERAFTEGFNLAFEKGLSPFFRTKRKATKRYGEIQMYPRSDTAYHSRSKRQEHATISLEVLICSGSLSDLRPLDFKNTTNNITFVDLSRYYLPFIHYRAFFGLYKLKYLNLSHNYAEKIHSEAFGGLETVEILDLENNLFGNALNEDRQGRLFYPFKLLKKINLSRNRIYKIDKNVLFHTVNLEELNLSDNYLENLNIDLSHLKSLKVLDLSINRLQTLPESVTNVLSMLANFHKVHVNLKQNNLDCNCETIHFLKWIFTSSIIFDSIDMYYCSFNNGSRRLFNETRVKLLESLEEECKSYLDVILGCTAAGSFAGAILVSYAVYRNRWKLRYMYYMAKVKIDKNENKEDDELYEYDAFISYGDGDCSFVVKDMVLQVEERGHKRLNIRDRDFDLGEVIALNISKAIRTSRKTILIISRYFLKNKWCNFEMNMAWMEEIHTKRKVIVIIFLEELPTKILPIELIDLLRNCPNLDRPQDEALMAAFWHRLIELINGD